MTAAERIARRLREVRAGRGLTRAQVCEKLGKDPITLYRYETGATAPDIDTLEALCRLYGVTLASVVDLPNAKPNI